MPREITYERSNSQIVISNKMFHTPNTNLVRYYGKLMTRIVRAAKMEMESSGVCPFCGTQSPPKGANEHFRQHISNCAKFA